MSLITASALAKHFGVQDLFSDLNASVPHGSRIALVGPNGAGKSTLLRILLGTEEPSSGYVNRARGLTLGYLPQETTLSAPRDRTVWEEQLTAFEELRAQEAELRRLETRMAEPEPETQHAATLERYATLLTRFEHAGGYEYEAQISATLLGLGFTPDDHARPLGQLSGGQLTRALLARLLLEKPTMLALDEPTNHLDIAAVEWLEQTLIAWPGAMLIVSHDRYFLDRVANEVWELNAGTLNVYRGNYSAYVLQRTERRAQQQKAYDNQQEHLAKEWDYIRRNMAGQNTRQAKGRLRRLERELGARRGRKLREELITVKERPGEAESLKLALETSLRSGDRVLETHALLVGHAGAPPLFACPDLLLWRGECAALIGPNGAGKTTFLRTILDELAPLGGTVRLGASLQVGYFAQTQSRLDPARTVLDTLLEAAPLRISEARDYLAQFLFTGDDVFKPISALSGGERARVALALLSLQGANFLLLDEPTNHLDLPAQEVLQGVLSEFPGTILLVTHDRYLVDALATQVWALERGGLRVYPGDYADYLAAREAERAAASAADASSKPRRITNDPEAERARKEQEKAAAARARRQAALENKIHTLEEKLKQLTAELDAASTARQLDRVQALGIEYARVETELNTTLEEWGSEA